MMVEDLGVEANEADVSEVVKLLSFPEHLQSVASIKDLEGIMSISVEAVEAQGSVSDDKELISTYDRFTALDGKQRFALAAAASHKEEAGRLRVVEMREILDQQLFEEAAEVDGGGACAVFSHWSIERYFIVFGLTKEEKVDLATEGFALEWHQWENSGPLYCWRELRVSC